jgi:hypothetical protein
MTRMFDRFLTLRRLLREVFVIVASILLAFSLDAWWNAQQQENEARALVDGLIREFDEAAAELDRVHARNGQVIAAADEILAMVRGHSGSALIDAQLLASLLLIPTTNPPGGALQALLSSGDLRLIPDRDLRARLADWPAWLADVQEEESVARAFVFDELLPFLRRETDVGAILLRRLESARSMRGEDVALNPAVSLPPLQVSIPIGRELVTLVETRRFHSQFVLTNHVPMRQAYDQIRSDLRAVF